MGLRETLNENPRLTTGITLGLIVIAGIFIIAKLWPSRPAAGLEIGKNYYTDDDGKTLFADEQNKPTPFTGPHGKEAVRVHAYKCPDGKVIAGWLEKFTDAGKRELEQYQSQPGMKGRMSRNLLVNDQLRLIKKPGDAKWMNAASNQRERVRIMTPPKCADGSDPEPVEP